MGKLAVEIVEIAQTSDAVAKACKIVALSEHCHDLAGGIRAAAEKEVCVVTLMNSSNVRIQLEFNSKTRRAHTL